eukprot:symbB.v1.2.025964.t1/scaffold2549.1/size76517/1
MNKLNQAVWPHIVVFLNKMDMVEDMELVELVELEAEKKTFAIRATPIMLLNQLCARSFRRRRRRKTSPLLMEARKTLACAEALTA